METVVMIQSELFEALEQYRNGKPAKYYECAAPSPFETEMIRGCGPVESGCLNTCAGHYGKPEGILFELADAVIRALDYLAQMEEEAEGLIKCDNDVLIECDIEMPLPELIFCANLQFAAAGISDIYDSERAEYLRGGIAIIETYCAGQGYDLDAAILEKHKFNKTRPYRHGGKII